MTIKQKMISGFMTLVVVVSGVTILPALPAYADCGAAKTAIINCSTTGDGKSTVMTLLLIVINILTIGIGVAAVGGVVYAAILYASAQDKAAQVTKAKTVIFDVVLGVGAYFLMYAFLQFIIPGGVFN